MKKILIISFIMLSLVGCKKKVEYEREVAERVQEQTNEAATVWKATAPSGTYNLHKLDTGNGWVKGIDENGHMIIIYGNVTLDTQAK